MQVAWVRLPKEHPGGPPEYATVRLPVPPTASRVKVTGIPASTRERLAPKLWMARFAFTPSRPVAVAFHPKASVARTVMRLDPTEVGLQLSVPVSAPAQPAGRPVYA